VTGGWRTLHNEEPHRLDASPNIVRVIKSRGVTLGGGHIARMRKMTNAYSNSVGKREGKRPLGRSRCRCKGNIRRNLREMEWEGVGRMYLTQDSDQRRIVVNTVMNLRVPQKAGNFLTSFSGTVLRGVSYTIIATFK